MRWGVDLVSQGDGECASRTTRTRPDQFVDYGYLTICGPRVSEMHSRSQRSLSGLRAALGIVV